MRSALQVFWSADPPFCSLPDVDLSHEKIKAAYQSAALCDAASRPLTYWRTSTYRSVSSPEDCVGVSSVHHRGNPEREKVKERERQGRVQREREVPGRETRDGGRRIKF